MKRSTSLAPLQVGSLLVTSLGGGEVELAGTVVTDTAGITYNAPVRLVGQGSFNTSASNGNITFSDTLISTQVGGPFAAIISAGTGNVTFIGSVGEGNPLLFLDILSAGNVTAGQIEVGHLEQLAGTGTSSFSGLVTTTDSIGIDLTGTSFSFTGGVVTTNGGGFSSNHTGTLTLASTVTLDGIFSQTGTGNNQAQGSLATNGDEIIFTGSVNLSGDFSMSSSGGNISILGGMEGKSSCSLAAGMGNISLTEKIATLLPLNHFIISSCNDATLASIGSSTKMLRGLLSITASDAITLNGEYYAAHEQVYHSTGETFLEYPSLMTMKTDGGSFTFLSPIVHINSLDQGTNLLISTGGGDMSFVSIEGTNFPDLTINARGSGLISAGSFTLDSSIGTVIMNGGEISFGGELSFTTGIFTTRGPIANGGAQVEIRTTGPVRFNSLQSDVGSLASPILVNSVGGVGSGLLGNFLLGEGDGEVFAGSSYLAAFDGVTIDNTIHAYLPNPPCVIYFNGVKIAECTPAGPLPFPSDRAVLATPGFSSSTFNLGSNYYFFSGFLNRALFGFSQKATDEESKKKETKKEAKKEKPVRYNKNSRGFLY